MKQTKDARIFARIKGHLKQELQLAAVLSGEKQEDIIAQGIEMALEKRKKEAGDTWQPMLDAMRARGASGV